MRPNESSSALAERTTQAPAPIDWYQIPLAESPYPPGIESGFFDPDAPQSFLRTIADQRVAAASPQHLKPGHSFTYLHKAKHRR